MAIFIGHAAGKKKGIDDCDIIMTIATVRDVPFRDDKKFRRSAQVCGTDIGRSLDDHCRGGALTNPLCWRMDLEAQIQVQLQRASR